ncbi:hypothetical protein B0H63DRAFT_478600 [Podospora didyma]|uniref:Secreted protein n=1 Tax=Podospora didyma TaxID=330526 RepID=A0AAE0KKP4_9PEZI|nr:hypothetical protein B0H63DRAFT_478600 [Podospora didyma]
MFKLFTLLLLIISPHLIWQKYRSQFALGECVRESGLFCPPLALLEGGRRVPDNHIEAQLTICRKQDARGIHLSQFASTDRSLRDSTT